jgi:hypothetical protein
MSRNSRVRDRGYVSSQVSIAAATQDNEFTVDYLVVAGGGGGGFMNSTIWFSKWSAWWWCRRFA